LNIKDYISSGILECYVLGQLNRTETELVEQLAAQYPEIREEIRSIEEGLENYASAHAKVPPLALKDKIIKDLWSKEHIVLPDTKTVEIYKINKIPAYLAAASITLALLFGSAALYYFKQWNMAMQQITLLQQENERTATNFNVVNHTLKNELQFRNDYLSLIRDTSTETIHLKGMPLSPASSAVVLWNKNSRHVYLDAKNMPRPPAGKQYQLWALQDGVPIDAGVFNIDNALPFQRMINIVNAQSFAITLEKTGGSSTPTLELLYVIGNI
jgi:anti-sigma-K factor RskA